MPLPASAINYAPYGDSVYVVEDMKDPKGKTYKGVRQQFVKLGPARGDQVAVLSGLKPGEEVVTSGVFKLRHGRRRAGQQQAVAQPGATKRDAAEAASDTGLLMKFTDLFIRRPVLAIVVNLVILIAGLQAIRSLSRPPVPAQRHRGRHGHDRLHRRQRRPRARLHHDAARARHRERRRHRLPRVVERPGRLRRSPST